MPKIKPKNTSWNQVAGWYQDLLEGDNTYQSQVILPNMLRHMAITKGQKILDIGCGQGYFSLAFGKLGAQVVGVDLGEALIAQAKLNTHSSKTTDVNFLVGDAARLGLVDQGDFDAATIILAIQNMESAKNVFESIASNLKVGAKLFLVLNHPAFRVPQFSAWGFDQQKNVEYRRVDRYLSDLKINIEMHPGLANSTQTMSFHRPLQHYFKALIKTGFVVTGLEEWTTHKRSDSGPKAKAENIAKAEIPMFLFLEATKL